MKHFILAVTALMLISCCDCPQQDRRYPSWMLITDKGMHLDQREVVDIVRDPETREPSKACIHGHPLNWVCDECKGGRNVRGKIGVRVELVEPDD